MESGEAAGDGDEAVAVEEVVAVGEVEVGADGAARGIDRRGGASFVRVDSSTCSMTAVLVYGFFDKRSTCVSPRCSRPCDQCITECHRPRSSSFRSVYMSSPGIDQYTANTSNVCRYYRRVLGISRQDPSPKRASASRGT